MPKDCMKLNLGENDNLGDSKIHLLFEGKGGLK